jgi:hypothetical protein
MPIEKSREPERFAAFELSGWNTNVGGYHSVFGALARQSVGPMLDAAGGAWDASTRYLLRTRHAGSGGVAARG